MTKKTPTHIKEDDVYYDLYFKINCQTKNIGFLYLFKLYVTIQLQGRLGSFFLSKNCPMGSYWFHQTAAKYRGDPRGIYRLRVFIKRKDYITKLRS